MPVFVSLASLLREVMRRHAVTAPELADLSGVKLRTLNSYLQGERELSMPKALPIFRALGWDDGTTAAAGTAITLGSAFYLPEGDDVAARGSVTRASELAPARHARNLPLAVREYLAEFRLRLTKGDATEEEIDEALELMRSPQVFTFYKGGALSEYSEDEVLRGMKAIGESVVIPELRERGRKIP